MQKTTEFYKEGQDAVIFKSYTNRVSSDCYLFCMEDSLLIVGKTEMHKPFPKLEQITRLMVEQDLGKEQDTLSRFFTYSSEERCIHLLKTDLICLA